MDYEAGGSILCRHAQSKWEEILTVSSEEAGSGAEICWNFEKMIIGKGGNKTDGTMW